MRTTNPPNYRTISFWAGWVVVLALLLATGWERTARVLWIVGCIYLAARWTTRKREVR